MTLDNSNGKKINPPWELISSSRTNETSSSSRKEIDREEEGNSHTSKREKQQIGILIHGKIVWNLTHRKKSSNENKNFDPMKCTVKLAMPEWKEISWSKKFFCHFKWEEFSTEFILLTQFFENEAVQTSNRMRTANAVVYSQCTSKIQCFHENFQRLLWASFNK